MSQMSAQQIQGALGCTSQWAYGLKKQGFRGHVSRMKQVAKLFRALGLELRVIEKKE